MTNSILIKVAIAFSTALIFSSCTQESNREGIDPAPQNKAAPLAQDSFQVSAPTAGITAKKDVAQVTILRSALEKEFLLTTNMLTQTPTPMFSSLQSRVVFFTLKNSRVYMLEATRGKTVGSTNPTAFLPLAEFEILDETNSEITIDFNLGMKNIITVGDMATFLIIAHTNLHLGQLSAWRRATGKAPLF